MNKILRIVGYIVLVLALAGSSIVFIQKNKEHSKLAGIQEKLEQAQTDYEQNQSAIEILETQIQALREKTQYVVCSASIPLYETNLPTGVSTKLHRGEFVYVDSIDESGMAHVTAEVNGEKGQYYTFAALLAKEPVENVKTVVISLDTDNRQVEFEQELPIVTALGESLTAAGLTAIWPTDQDSCGNDWSLIASDCGADAHLIIRAGAKVAEGSTCLVGIPADVENKEESKALSRKITAMLAVNNLAEMPSEEELTIEEIVEESGTDETAETDDQTDSSTEAEPIIEVESSTEAEISTEAEPIIEVDSSTETEADIQAPKMLTCIITANVLTVQNAEEIETEEVDGETAEISEDETPETEDAESESLAAETGVDSVEIIVNSIVAAIKDFWGIN